MDISRRFFLIGSAAAIAVAKLPPLVAEERIAVTPIPAMASFKHRRICDLSVGFWDTGGHTDFEMFVRGESFIHGAIGDGGVLRWIPTPGHEIILMPGETVALSVKPGQRYKGGIQLIVADTVDEGPPIMRSEMHQYPFDKPVLCDLDADNSLAARIERKRLADEAAARLDATWEWYDGMDDDMEGYGA